MLPQRIDRGQRARRHDEHDDDPSPAHCQSHILLQQPMRPHVRNLPPIDGVDLRFMQRGTGTRFCGISSFSCSDVSVDYSLPRGCPRQLRGAKEAAMLRRRSFLALLIPSIIVLLPATCLRADPVLPDFQPSNFIPDAPIDNPFFPLSVGTTFRWEATVTDPEDGSTSHQVEQDFVTSQTKTLGGVLARVVHSTVHVDGEQ